MIRTKTIRILLPALLGLLLPVLSVGQFVRVNLDISPKTTTEQPAPFYFSLQPDFNSGMLELAGTIIFTIAGNENMHVLATISHNDSLYNELLHHSLPLTASLAYRNDGRRENPGMNDATSVYFPLSNSGRLIMNIKSRPQVLRAYLFINARTKLPQFVNTTYVGNIYLYIEYN